MAVPHLPAGGPVCSCSALYSACRKENTAASSHPWLRCLQRERERGGQSLREIEYKYNRTVVRCTSFAEQMQLGRKANGKENVLQDVHFSFSSHPSGRSTTRAPADSSLSHHRVTDNGIMIRHFSGTIPRRVPTASPPVFTSSTRPNPGTGRQWATAARRILSPLPTPRRITPRPRDACKLLFLFHLTRRHTDSPI